LYIVNNITFQYFIGLKISKDFSLAAFVPPFGTNIFFCRLDK